MRLTPLVAQIRGAAELHDWFGYWPTFHDAEIVEVRLERKASSLLRLHAWETTKEIDENGSYVQAKHVVVEFILNNVTALELTGFNRQNVISSLTIEKTASGISLELGPCYGLSGMIEAESIEVRLVPGIPALACGSESLTQ